MKRIFLILLSALALVPLAPVLSAAEVDAVMLKDGKTFTVTDEQRLALTAELKFPDKVTVTTNGTFTVGDGKERKLAEGQLLRRDGWLVSTDGSVQPVINHVTMKEGRVYLVRDGQAVPLPNPVTFPNGMVLNPDGYGSNLPGGRARLIDGQLFRLDGSILQGKDTATLKNGRVVVQKDGSLIPLPAVTIMGMSDGTRVHGDGTIQKQDGTTFKLREGQTILIEGAYYGR